MDDWRSFRPMGSGPAFTLRNRLERALWRSVWLLLARWTPPPLFRWRAFLLRLFGARIGTDARIYASVQIWLPRNLAVGNGSMIGPGARLYNQGRIRIGQNAVISQNAHLCASTHDLGDQRFPLVCRAIRIGDACWVAADAFVGPGVTMRPGSVLGARGALFEDASEMTVYRGNPAISLKKRIFRK